MCRALQRILLTSTVAVVLSSAAPAHALPQIRQLQVGDSVRVRLPGALRVDASMHEMRNDTLLLIVSGISGVWPVAGRDLVTLDRYTDRTPQQGFRNGAVLGVVIGVFAGAATGLVLHVTGVIDDPEEPPAQLFGNALKWAGLGIVVGGFGGGFIGGRNPGKGWIRVELSGR